MISLLSSMTIRSKRENRLLSTFEVELDAACGVIPPRNCHHRQALTGLGTQYWLWVCWGWKLDCDGR